ncbi:hypothetical protein PHLGIDRAFT_19585 [Phlebiopsis gigantea 11061_1 CR5-6]|uniref:Uncharacterized protein n=1 Tax=Phlebiopsis gigantea (strain 11061_1 CR5-6) TaxID=745531 RepID=A0A0C3S931_PHLG1|nr:hypothetical protein PHLGIDRAFT_19585 [Phlebiopsis gigantea 11061_1 CR5-6]
MYASLVSVVALASFVAAQSFTVNTPNTPIECVPTQITWTTGGTAPFTLVIQEPDANGTPVQIYSGINTNSFSWSTNITSGTSIGITVRDNSGVNAQSAPVTIAAGTSDSCLSTSGGGTAASSSPAATGASSSAPAGTSSVSTPATSASSSVAATSSAATSGAATSGAATSGAATSSASHSSAASGSGTSAASSSSPSATGASSGAGANTVAMGALGFVGAIVAAVMA